ncbi:MAG: threonine synthase [Saprospiraceae bacterium]|nr:threonine synthase [Bacteroidia bacterium]NNE13389.1 threonine synthase [Saprospiraceae bacterium]NNL93661.1 threonine synthase [Saprospiraceae bacterium]
MKLYSTNNPDNIVSLKEAVINAFPIDKGLYMPQQIPIFSKEELLDMWSYSFPELSQSVAKKLIGNLIPQAELEKIIKRAINFPAPVVTFNDQLSTLELFHGPTMAFKDFGARFMAELMSYFLRGETAKTTILVATSGDTGGAVASGFHNTEGIDVVILYPSGKVSPLQEKQLTTWGSNIKAVEVKGVFDDCQRLVKQAFLDNELNDNYSFSSANSINIARLIPQSFYYFEAYKQLRDKFDDIVFSVPSGNFGNLTAGLIAKKMGLPISKFLAATNMNNTVPLYLSTGNYQPKPSLATISNAMDVGSPSNFSRIQSLYSSTWNMLKKDIKGSFYTDDQTVSGLKELKDLYNYIADPHGAIGYLASKEYLKKTDCHCVFLETAHPAKFQEVVEPVLEDKINIPTKLLSFMEKEKHAYLIENSFEDFKSLLLDIHSHS